MSFSPFFLFFFTMTASWLDSCLNRQHLVIGDQASESTRVHMQPKSKTTSPLKSWQKALIRAGLFHLLPAATMCNSGIFSCSSFPMSLFQMRFLCFLAVCVIIHTLMNWSQDCMVSSKFSQTPLVCSTFPTFAVVPSWIWSCDKVP